VLALEPLVGVRVVADPGALDAVTFGTGILPLRFAPDELLAVGATHVAVSDPHAIVEPDTTFVCASLTLQQFASSVEPLIEWRLPDTRPALAQGRVAGLPIKLYLDDHRVLLVVSRSLAHEAQDRFG
jgi:hypothetical protein